MKAQVVENISSLHKLNCRIFSSKSLLLSCNVIKAKLIFRALSCCKIRDYSVRGVLFHCFHKHCSLRPDRPKITAAADRGITLIL